MKLAPLQAGLCSAVLLASAQTALASEAHRHAHAHYAKRQAHAHGHGHTHSERAQEPQLEKRATCSLPDHPDLVHVPGAQNGGFAQSGDRPCYDGMYCPIACRSGMVMNQWQPGTTYTYPQSMNGGLLCDAGTPKKPFTDASYCVEGTGSVQAVNTCGPVVSFCQTVLPGDEAMLIPNDVTGTLTLAVPSSSYWDGTSAHFYINPPGVGSGEGCFWGNSSAPIGNWSPYVAGANTDASGLTFVKIAWNPIWIGEPGLNKNLPTFGVRIECDSAGCNGAPCEINPAKSGVNGIVAPDATIGVGSASFCVVTVPKGQNAKIVVFNTDGSTSGGSSGSSGSHSSSKAASTTAPPPPPTTSSEKPPPTTSKPPQHSSLAWGGIFHENSTSTTATSTSASVTVVPTTTIATATPTPTTSKNDGGSPDQGGAAVVGLIVALVAAAWLY